MTLSKYLSPLCARISCASILLFLLFLRIPVDAQTWWTPSPRGYPSAITGFAGYHIRYGYNRQGDLYRVGYDRLMWQDEWVLSMRGSLQGLNHLDSEMEFAVGDRGAMWRTDYYTDGFYIPLPRATDADLRHSCPCDLGSQTRFIAVGARGTIVAYDATRDSSYQLIGGDHPDLFAIIEARSPSRLITVGDSGCILTSDDRGFTWKREDRAAHHRYRSIARLSNSVVLIGGDDAETGEGLVIRTDALLRTWIERRIPKRGCVTGIRWNERKWYAFGTEGFLAFSSDSANSWSTPPHGTRMHFHDMVVSTRTITAIGRSPEDGHFRSMFSQDTGKSWRVWIEREDSLQEIAISRRWIIPNIVVTRSGLILNMSSNYELPSTVVQQVPFALTACIETSRGGCVVGGSNGRILISDDAGQSWRSTAALSDDIVCIERNPLDSLLALTNDSRIFRSGDRGNTWHCVYVSPARERITSILAKGVDTCLAIGTNAGDGVALLSPDGGAQWTTILRHPGPLVGIDRDSAGTVYVATRNGVLLRSSDQGGNWSVLLRHEGAILGEVSVGSRSRIYVAVGGDGILCSTNGGAQWTMRRFHGERIEHLVASSTRVLAWGGDFTLFAYGDRDAFREPMKKEVAIPTAAVPLGDRRFVGVGMDGRTFQHVWFTASQWQSTRVAAPVTTHLRDVCTWNSLDLLAVGDSGIVLKGRQPGDAWEVMHQDPACRPLTMVRSFPSGAAVAAGPSILLRSSPDGAHWVETAGFPGGQLAAPLQHEWYVLTEDRRVLFSEDEGAHWSVRGLLPHTGRACAGFGAGDVFVLCVDTFQTPTRSIVYRSTDHAFTWEPVFTTWGALHGLYLFDNCRVILTGEHGHVYVGENRGRSWIESQSRHDVVFRAVLPLHERSEEAPQYLFIASERAVDLMMLDKSVLAQSDPSVPPDGITMTELYPNPARNILHVRATGASIQKSRLSLHDMLGREIWSGTLEPRTSGGWGTDVDVARFARGMYLLRVGGAGVHQTRLVHLR